MKPHIITTAMLLLSLGKSFAQLNESDTLRFQLRASLTGSYQHGNVEVLNIKGRLDLTFSQQHWVYKSQNSSLYQAFYNTKADNDIFSRNYLYYQPRRRVYPFAIAYLSTNFRRKISNRYFAGTGVSWQVINTPKTVIKLSASEVYEVTKFTSKVFNYSVYNGSEAIKLWRGTLYLSGWHNLMAGGIRLYYDAYWQPSFRDRHNYRTQLDIGTDLSVWKGFSFTALFTYMHENVVAAGIRQNDKLLSFGLSYNLKRK